MKKYKVFVNGGAISAEQLYYSSSRNSKLHIRETGADVCEVFDMQNRQVSSAKRLPDGRVVNTAFVK